MSHTRHLAALVAVGLFAVAGCSSDATRGGDPALPQRPADAVTVRTAAVTGLGRVLTDGGGQVLYMFPPDARQRVSCVGACAGTWPPLALAAGRTPRATDGALPSKLGTVSDPNTGGRVVTYNGYPLYRYAGDLAAGQARGQALTLNGGPWYVLSPAGTPLTTAVSR